MPRRKKRKTRKRRKNIAAALLVPVFKALIIALAGADTFFNYVKSGRILRGKYFIHTIIICLIAAIGLGTFGIYRVLTKVNAGRVFVGEEAVSVINNLDVTAEYITSSAISNIQSKQNARIIVNEKITIEPIHAKRKEMFPADYVASEVAKKLTFKIEAAEITVDNQLVGTLKTRESANALLDRIKQRYSNEGLNIISYEFVENVQIKDVFVDSDEISDELSIETFLTESKDETISYNVNNGDSIWELTQEYGLTDSKIYELNPELAENPSGLRAGQNITLIRKVPFLQVKTTDRQAREEIIPVQNETRHNAALSAGYSQITQQGIAGKKLVTIDIIRINGYEVRQEVVSEEIIQEMLPQITESG
ncbi:MAG: G5 domain-containing protein [Clostridiales bacterium]|jgi:LysM repeat protein|nr:G5 domain-containing protein [Clostridiales bacterium]